MGRTDAVSYRRKYILEIIKASEVPPTGSEIMRALKAANLPHLSTLTNDIAWLRKNEYIRTIYLPSDPRYARYDLDFQGAIPKVLRARES